MDNKPKFRISTWDALKGDVNPIQYDVIEYNNDIEYNNGVIIILQPGWYTFNANIRGSNLNDASQFISEVIVIDNIR